MSKVKKFGSGSVQADSTRKWAVGMKSQLEQPGLSINARMVPMANISLDPKNPRELSISIDVVRSTASKHPVPYEWLANTPPTNQQDWENYAANIHLELRSEAAEEYLKIALLAMTIKTPEGLVNPVTTYLGDSGTDLRLIAGERRYLAHIILGLDTIATRILQEAPSNFEIDLLQWHENNQREGLSLIESVMSIERLCEGWAATHDKPPSVRKLVFYAGITQTNATRYLAVLRSPHKNQIVGLIQEGKIGSLSKAASLAGLSKAELKAFLSPAPVTPKSTHRFKIHRSTPLSPLQTLITRSAAMLADDELKEQMASKPPSTVEECAEAFDQLLKSIERQTLTETEDD